MNACTNHMIIFSVFQKDKPAKDNFTAHMLVESLLKTAQLDYKELGGMYKGTPEQSFLVVAPFGHLSPVLANIRKIAKRYNQESILYIDNEKNAYLDDLIGQVEKIGKLTPTTQEDAVKQDGYSLDLSTGQYYVIK
jgi:hypothetical protein